MSEVKATTEVDFKKVIHTEQYFNQSVKEFQAVQSRSVSAKFDTMMSLNIRTKAWDYEDAKPFTSSPDCFKASAEFTKGIKDIAGKCEITEGHLVNDAKITHHLFDSLWSDFDGKSFNQAKMYTSITAACAKIRTFSHHTATWLMNEKAKLNGDETAIAINNKAFELLKSTADMNINQIGEKIFKDAVIALKSIMDAKAKNYDAVVSLAAFLPLPTIDSEKSPTQNARAITSAMNDIDLANETFNLSKDGMIQRVQVESDDTSADDTTTEVPVLSESEKAFKMMKDRVVAENPNATVSDAEVIAKYSEIVSLDSTIDSVNVDAINDGDIDIALDRLEKQVAVLTDGLKTCKNAITTLTERKIEIDKASAKDAVDKFSDAELLEMMKTRGLAK